MTKMHPALEFVNFFPRYLQPDYEVPGTLAALDVSHLQNEGIRAVLLDVDNTLCEYHGVALDPAVRHTVAVLRGCGFKIAILSNTTPERRAQLSGYFSLPVVDTEARKPEPEAFQDALQFLGSTPADTAMVGDRLLTDIAGANRAGLYSVRVQPLGYQPLSLRIPALLETFLLRLYQE